MPASAQLDDVFLNPGSDWPDVFVKIEKEYTKDFMVPTLLTLKDGDIPLVMFNADTSQWVIAKNISTAARELGKLIRISRISVVKNGNETPIRSMSDLMGVEWIL